MAMRDEYADMFPHLNRTAVVVRHKKALYDWLNSVEPENPVDPDEEREDNGSIYLLPNMGMMDEWQPALKKCYKTIFEAELWSWLRDDKKWPKDRTWEKFCEFFVCDFISGVVDMDDEKDIYND